MTELNINVDIKPRGIVSAYVRASFDKGKEVLEEQSYSVISLEENARLRIQQSVEHYVSQYGNWVREGILCVPKKGIFLTKKSPIMQNPIEATNFHRNGEHYHLTNEQVEEALSDSVAFPKEAIPTDRFADTGLTVFAFGGEKQAGEYGNWLQSEAKIKEMPVWLNDIQDKAFATQVWFRNLVGGSELSGSRYLSYDFGVRGVCKCAEGTAKNLGIYTEQDIQRVLKEKHLDGIEGILLDGLKH